MSQVHKNRFRFAATLAMPRKVTSCTAIGPRRVHRPCTSVDYETAYGYVVMLFGVCF